MSDNISRQAALDAIHEDADWLAAQGSDWQKERMERDKSILQSLPSARTETGRWENVGMYTVECSECKAQLHELEYANFCPNCGADMRGESE